MRRRTFITLLGGAALAPAVRPLIARAQQADRIRSVGVLTPYTEEVGVDRDDDAAFVQAFQRLGWQEGRNFHLDYRAAGPDPDKLQAAAAAMVASKPDVIFAVSSAALKAVQADTKTIPIVFVGVTDPVGQGFVADLAHPGGNVTGFNVFEFSIGAKWIELLKEISPGLSHFALVFNRETTPGGWLPLIQSSAPVLGIEVNEAPVNDDNDIDNAIAVLKTASGGGVIVLPSAFTLVHRQHIIDFAAKYRLPAIYWDSRFVKAGGLMSYAYDLDDQVRSGAAYVDRILKGAKPGDLPVKETTKFDLVINLKTATALGLTIPPSLLSSADQVIQ